MTEREPVFAAPRFTPSRAASEDILEARILVAFTYPHGHPGVAGVAEGEGCPRCNAEQALDELLHRAAHSWGAGVVSERTPFPEIDTTEGTGYEWLGRFMEAQAGIAANSMFFTFKLGQLGIAVKHDADLARAMLDDLRTDCADLAFASEQLLKVIDGLIANIDRQLSLGAEGNAR